MRTTVQSAPRTAYDPPQHTEVVKISYGVMKDAPLLTCLQYADEQWRTGAGPPQAGAGAGAGGGGGVDSDWRQAPRGNVPPAVAQAAPKSREEELSMLRGITPGGEADTAGEAKEPQPSAVQVRALVEDAELEEMCFRPARAKK
jgi:hypothetical protein